MDDFRAEHRKLILSVLSSSPKRITIAQLEKEFKDIMGMPIPYRKLGYSCLEEYLYSLKDCLTILGRGPFAEILPESDKSAHIRELISNQKEHISKKRPPKHMFRPPHQFGFSRPRYNNHNQNQNRNQYSNYLQNSNFNEPAYSYNSRPSCSNYQARDIRVEEVETGQENSKVTPKKDVEIEESGITNVIPGGCESDDSDDLEMEENNDEIYISDDENEKEKLDYKLPVNLSVPKKVQENLQELIGDHPEGIWCTELLEIYKRRFNSELNYSRFGYNSLLVMCTDLPTIFYNIRPNKGDLKLFDKRQSLPKDISEFADLMVKVNELGIETSSQEQAQLPALPPSIVFEDCLGLNDEIPRIELTSAIKLQEYIDCKVSQVYDPSKIWINIRNTDESKEDTVDVLMDELQSFYTIQCNCLEIPYEKMVIGLYCAVYYCEEYHRAIIIQTNLQNEESQDIKVFFIDYGTIDEVPIPGVCYLHKRFGKLPQQAVRCRLAGIYPPREKTQWSRRSSQALHEIVFQKSLVALVDRLDDKRQVLEIYLTDTNTEVDTHINDLLVEQGHAVFTSTEQIPLCGDDTTTTSLPPPCEPIVRYIHLFPTFLEIEHGIVPSIRETSQFRRLGVPVYNLYPHYFRSTTRHNNQAGEEEQNEEGDDVHPMRITVPPGLGEWAGGLGGGMQEETSRGDDDPDLEHQSRYSHVLDWVNQIRECSSELEDVNGVIIPDVQSEVACPVPEILPEERFESEPILESEQKLVITAELDGIKLTFVKHTNDIFVLVEEIMTNFIKQSYSIIQIRKRCVYTLTPVNSVFMRYYPILKEQLTRCGCIDESYSAVHMVSIRYLPQFLKTFLKPPLPLNEQKFNEFSRSIRLPSDIWQN